MLLRHVLLKRQVAARYLFLCPPLFPLSLSLSLCPSVEAFFVCLSSSLPLSLCLRIAVCLFVCVSLSLSLSRLSLSLERERDTDKGVTEPMDALSVSFCDICDTCT